MGRMDDPSLNRPAAILVAEDNALVAWDLCEALAEAGYPAVSSCNTAAGAIAWITTHRPAGAIIDVRLRDGASDALADALRGWGIPFVVHTDRERDGSEAPAFQEAPWFEKPTARAAIINGLDQAIGAAGIDA